MSFALIDNFRKDPAGVAARSPIVSFDHEQSADGTAVLKQKGSNERFSVKGEKRIAALDFDDSNGTLVMKVRPSEVNARIAEGWMPFYYLPWIRNAIARTTLRPRSQTARDGSAKGLATLTANNLFRVDQNNAGSAVLDPNDPDVFITSSVNGCSVTVRGSREEPTVYHGNAISLADATGETGPVGHAVAGRTQAANNLIDLKRQDMARMLTAFEAADPKASRFVGAQTPAQGKMLTQQSYQMLLVAGQVGKTDKAAASQIADGIAAEQHTPKKFVRLTSSQGTVFGVRRAGLWTFYYQKLVKYELGRDDSRFYQREHWVRQAGSVSFRLVEFGEFWPGGPGVLIP